MLKLFPGLCGAITVFALCLPMGAAAAEPPAEGAAISAEQAEFFERKIRPLLAQRRG